MKAKEYYAKYCDRLMANDIQFTPEEKRLIASSKEEEAKAAARIEESLRSAISDLVIEMSQEAKSICETRKARQASAVLAVIREMNDRWNKVRDMIAEKSSMEVLVKDGFLEYWFRQMPELKMTMEIENDKRKRRT